MKDLIKETNLTVKQFADLYNIPYNTVLGWYKEQRKAPQYLVDLIRENRELKSKGKQLTFKFIKKT